MSPLFFHDLPQVAESDIQAQGENGTFTKDIFKYLVDTTAKRRWWLYAVYSLLFLLVPVFTSPDFGLDFRFLKIQGFRENFLSYFLLLLFFFLNTFYLLPKFYFPRRLWIFWGVIFLCFFLYTFLPMQIFPHIVRHGHWEEKLPKMAANMLPDAHHHHPRFGFLITRYVTQFALVGLFSYSIAINLRWKETEKARLNAELSYLKAQINPHFLFNSLNSIYALAIEKSDDTADSVVRLSGLMRYVISEASKDFVPLSKEIEYISNYISLQETRISPQTKFSYSVTGDSNGKQIAPMLMIPFIENAFKYGINPDEDCDLKVEIVLSEKELNLNVENRKVAVRISEDAIGGVGIENARRRLQAVYAGRYILDISDKKEIFSVTLKILL